MRDPAAKVLKYLDDFKSAKDDKELREEFSYEIDYDRLVGVGNNSAVFLAHPVNEPAPPLDSNGLRPLYTLGYDIAVKVIVKKWISAKRPSKTRTGNLKLALTLGQTKPENNILKVIDVLTTTERIFIFMQYCAYGNVISFIRRNGQVSSKLAQRWASQMAAALSFLHRLHVAHRNYKLENVLIDENLNVKLTGFGLSKFCIDPETKQPVLSRTICGSEPYLAPEMLRESSERLYDPKQADVWAFGVGLFLCATRRYPFEANNLRALRAEQAAGKYLERDTKHRMRTVVRELLAQIFVIDPGNRPSMQDLINSNPWLNKPGRVPPPVLPPSLNVSSKTQSDSSANQSDGSGATPNVPITATPTAQPTPAPAPSQPQPLHRLVQKPEVTCESPKDGLGSPQSPPAEGTKSPQRPALPLPQPARSTASTATMQQRRSPGQGTRQPPARGNKHHRRRRRQQPPKGQAQQQPRYQKPAQRQVAEANRKRATMRAGVVAPSAREETSSGRRSTSGQREGSKAPQTTSQTTTKGGAASKLDAATRSQTASRLVPVIPIAMPKKDALPDKTA